MLRKLRFSQKKNGFLFKSDFLGLKSANTTYNTDISRPKCVDFSCNQYIISEYPDILAQKNMHQYLILFKNVHDFINFSCLIFREKRSQFVYC